MVVSLASPGTALLSGSGAGGQHWKRAEELITGSGIHDQALWLSSFLAGSLGTTTGFGSGGSGFGPSEVRSGKRGSNRQRQQSKSNHRREQCPMGRDPDLVAIKARQTLGLPLTGRLTEQQVKRVHKLLAIQHHPDKGGDPETMTRFNHARDVLLEPTMEAIAS